MLNLKKKKSEKINKLKIKPETGPKVVHSCSITDNYLNIILRTSLSGVFRHRFELKIEKIIFKTTAF